MRGECELIKHCMLGISAAGHYRPGLRLFWVYEPAMQAHGWSARTEDRPAGGRLPAHSVTYEEMDLNPRSVFVQYIPIGSGPTVRSITVAPLAIRDLYMLF